jgi:hypothetical protein
VRNLRFKLRKRCTGSNLVDLGRDAVRGCPTCGPPTPDPEKSSGPVAVPKDCGVGTVKLSGQSRAPILADRYTGNVGTIRDRPRTVLPGRERGQARRRLMVSWWGGGPVVVRARERRVHGEGGQGFLANPPLGSRTTEIHPADWQTINVLGNRHDPREHRPPHSHQPRDQQLQDESGSLNFSAVCDVSVTMGGAAAPA